MTHSPNILVIGGANLDLTGTGSQPLLAGDSNLGHIQTAAGGVGRNIAENLARLGAKTRLLSLTGDDAGRVVIEQSCQQSGIDTTFLLKDSTRTTGTYLSINQPDGEMAMAVSDMSVVDCITPELLERHDKAFTDCDEIVVEANLSAATLQWIAKNHADKPIHADGVSVAKCIKLKPLLAKLTTLKVNRAEAAAILGREGDDASLAGQLRECGVKHVLLSLGEEGARLHCEQGVFAAHPFEVQGCSVNGCGDAMLAGMISAAHWLEDQAHQLQYALACAAYTLSCADAVNPLISAEAVRSQFLSHLPKRKETDIDVQSQSLPGYKS